VAWSRAGLCADLAEGALGLLGRLGGHVGHDSLARGYAIARLQRGWLSFFVRDSASGSAPSGCSRSISTCLDPHTELKGHLTDAVSVQLGDQRHVPKPRTLARAHRLATTRRAGHVRWIAATTGATSTRAGGWAPGSSAP